MKSRTGIGLNIHSPILFQSKLPANKTFSKWASTRASRASGLNIPLLWKKARFPLEIIPHPLQKEVAGENGNWFLFIRARAKANDSPHQKMKIWLFVSESEGATEKSGEDSLLSANESLAITLRSDCAFVSLPAFHVPACWLAASAILPAQQADELLFNKALVNLFPPGDPYFLVR